MLLVPQSLVAAKGDIEKDPLGLPGLSRLGPGPDLRRAVGVQVLVEEIESRRQIAGGGVSFLCVEIHQLQAEVQQLRADLLQVKSVVPSFLIVLLDNGQQLLHGQRPSVGQVADRLGELGAVIAQDEYSVAVAGHGLVHDFAYDLVPDSFLEPILHAGEDLAGGDPGDGGKRFWHESPPDLRQAPYHKKAPGPLQPRRLVSWSLPGGAQATLTTQSCGSGRVPHWMPVSSS